MGNRLQTVEQYTQGQIRTIVRDYEYDDLYRLTSAVESYEGPPPEVIETSYSYDPVGNRLSMTTNRPEQGPAGDPLTTVYSYNEANWLLTATTDNKTTAYDYDANGNRIRVTHPGGPPGPPQGIVESYQYDFENRLVEYERTGDGAVRRAFMAYDGLGRRFAKGTQQGGGNVFWTEYAYQQLSMDPLAEYPQTGPPRITHLYRGRAGTLIGMEEQQGGGPGKEYWFSQDGLGNIATVTKHSGQSAHDYFYDPYGNIIDNNGRPEDSSNWTDPHNHYLLNGKEWDEEMRLHYFGTRYYDSAAGVWLTQDIYRGEPRQPMTLHRTLYVLANPVNYVDAYGYMAEIIPNGYMDAGGGSQATDTTWRQPPNPARQDNPPYHFDPPDLSDPDFQDRWEQFEAGLARERDRLSIISPTEYDEIVLIGLDKIPVISDDLLRIGLIEVNYRRDFGSLGLQFPDRLPPRNVMIIYHSPVAMLDISGWDNVTDDLDLLARIVEQEAAGLIHIKPQSHDVEMVGVAQVALGRVGTGYGSTLREVLLRPNQFAFTLLGDQAEDASDAARYWADALSSESQQAAYERALSVTVGVDQGWLYDPRTATATEFRGTHVEANPNYPWGGFYSRFYETFPVNPIVVDEYPPFPPLPPGVPIPQ